MGGAKNRMGGAMIANSFYILFLQEDKVFLCELFTQIQDTSTSEGQFQELVWGWCRGHWRRGH